MLDLHYWPTPNGKKVTILLEECGLPYNVMYYDSTTPVARTLHHGSWVTGGHAEPESFFCPDNTYSAPTNANYKTIAQTRIGLTGPWRELLDSGGQSGSASGEGICSATSYALNLLLLWNTEWPGHAMNSKKNGWRLGATQPEFPLMADARSYTKVSTTNHNGAGFSVGYVDGSVEFLRTSTIIRKKRYGQLL